MFKIFFQYYLKHAVTKMVFEMTPVNVAKSWGQ